MASSHFFDLCKQELSEEFWLKVHQSAKSGIK